MKPLFATGGAKAPSLAEAYDRVAATWHATICKFGFVEAYEDLLALAGRQVPDVNRRDLEVLDAGSGTAAFSLAFSRQFACHSFDLLDVSPEMLDRGAQTLAAEGVTSDRLCCDIRALPERPKRYDVILSAHLIEHVDDVDEALRAFRSVLSPGGLLVLVVSKPHWCTTLVRMRWGHRAYRPEEMQAHLRANGFRTVEPYSFTAGPPKRLSAGYIATC
ncbi:MAG: class I SAM-dependent methyltransferase [Alphaproteobacteria bacterium]|nr:class I SAM-dependent methyltransferase [Alphaproteobacteria bacterium]